MKVNQMYSLLNDINQQLWSEDVQVVEDLSGIISMGTSIIGNAFGTDKFLNTLVDRIGKTVIRTLDLELTFPAMFMDSFEFGAVLQKITVNPFGAMNNTEWDVGSGGFSSDLMTIVKPQISVKYFQGVDTWKFQVTIPDDMLFTAFQSESAMANFFDAIIGSMTDSMTISINNLSRTAVNNFIAEKVKANNSVVNLLGDYNTLFGQTLTEKEALHDKEFLRYAVTEIGKWMKWMSEPSMAYNTDGIVRATARDNAHAIFITDFIRGCDTYLLSDSFHNDLLKLPGFVEIGYWQSNKDSGGYNDFDTNGTINVIPSSEEGQLTPTAVVQSGVIGVYCDRQAIAVGIDKRKAGSWYNAIDGFEQIKRSATIQYINDLSESGVVFVIDDGQ